MALEIIDSPHLPDVRDIGIAHAVKYGDLVHVSGMVSFDAEGTLIGKGDIETQTRQTYECIRVILDGLGATLSDVVKITTFLLDVDDFPAVCAVRRELFGADHRPASSAVVVKELVVPDALIEIEAVAVVPG